MIDDAMNQKKTSDKSERDQELENNQCTPKVIKKKKFEQIDTPMGLSCTLPPYSEQHEL